MFKRAWFLAITLFWVTMNILLWRSEMSLGREFGSPLPVASVWERMLTAPDESAMDVYHRGRKIGYIRWVPKVLEKDPAPPGEEADPNAPEGRVQGITGYDLLVDGNLALEDSPRRFRFTLQATLDRDQAWQTVVFRLNLRPNPVEVRAVAATESLTVQLGEGSPAWTQTFALKDLANPQALLGMLGLPLPFQNLPGLLPSARGLDPKQLALGLEWQAWNDVLKIGTARTRVYRLKARLLGEHETSLLVSRVGEILRLELPDRLLLLNEALPLLPEPRERERE